MEDLKNQIINKAGFLVYTDYWEKYFCKMSCEQIKETLSIVFHFNKTFEILATTDLAVEMVATTWIDSIKRDALKRNKQAEASKINGKLGGRPKKDEIKPLKEIKSSKFAKPTLEEIKGYCLERSNNVDSEKFFSFYESNGWKVGKNLMKNWKAAIHTWEKPQEKANIQENDDIAKDINKIIGQKLVLRTFKDSFGGIKLYVPSEIEKNAIKSLKQEKRDYIKTFLKNEHNAEIKIIEINKKSYEK